MQTSEKVKFISNWIKDYVNNMPTKAESLVIGISGGIDSSVSSTLSAMTGLKTIVLSMPIKQKSNQHDLSLKHQDWLVKNFKNVEAHTINLDELFEHIISGDETEKNKPHPEPYLIMMEKLSVKPENVVVIEDSLHGIQAALASGAAVIAKTGSVPESNLSIAHRIITHLDEITHNMIEDLLQGDK